MKKLAYIRLLSILLLASCVPVTKPPTTVGAVTETAMPLPTSTKLVLATATKHPGATPTHIIPTKTITPIAVSPVSAHPLALNEFNAGTEMKRLRVIGTGTPHDLEFSPDGKKLAIATGRGIFLYDGATFEQNGFIDVDDSVSAIAFSPDGNVLAVAIDGKVSLWNVVSGQQMMNLEGELVSIYKLAYGLGGYVAAIGGTCRGCGSPQIGVRLWNAQTGRQIFEELDIWHSTAALSFTQDGKQLFLGGRGGIETIESETGKLVASYHTDGSRISAAIDAPYDFIFNHDGTQLFVTSYEEPSEIFDFATQTRLPFTLCDNYLTSNNEYGACSKAQKILIFDLESGAELHVIDTDIDASSLGDMFVLSPDNNFLVYYGKTGVNIIDIRTGEEIAKIQLTDFGIAETGIVKIDGIELYAVATLAYSGQVDIFDIETGELIRELKVDCCEINGFSFAPDHKTFATVDTRNLRIWDLQAGVILYEVDLKEDFSGPISFSPDGSSVFLTHIAEDYVVELNLQSRKIINQGYNTYAYDYADPFAVENYHFNDLGHLVMLNYEKKDGEYYPSFIDMVTSEKTTFPYNAYPDPLFIEAFSLSSDGRYIAFGNPTETLVWDTATMKLQSKFVGHEWRSGDGWYGRIKNLVFSPQSNLLVSTGWDGTIRLWNARFGTELRRFNVCCSVAFTPDGRYLITFGNGVAFVWGIPE